jgi:hypothetical protein
MANPLIITKNEKILLKEIEPTTKNIKEYLKRATEYSPLKTENNLKNKSKRINTYRG